MEVIICKDCNSAIFFNQIKSKIEKFFENVIQRENIKTIEKIIITNDDFEKYEKAVKINSLLINARPNVSIDGVAVVIDGIVDNNLKQYIFIKEMVIELSFMEILKLTTGINGEDKLKQTAVDISIPTIFHEIGHAIDNEKRFINGLYINTYSVDSEDKYFEYENMTLWSEYFANRFMYKYINNGSKYENEIIQKIEDKRFYGRDKGLSHIYRTLYFYNLYIAYYHSFEQEATLYKRIDDKDIVDIFKTLDNELKKLYVQYNGSGTLDITNLIKCYKDFYNSLYNGKDKI